MVELPQPIIAAARSIFDCRWALTELSSRADVLEE
jgi:hypothetical protein